MIQNQLKMAYKSIQLRFHKNLLIIASVFMASGLMFNFQSIYSIPLGQAGNSVYDKACGTNIPNNGAAKDFLTGLNNVFGPNAEEAGPELKETYDCVNTIYEQETGNNIETQLDDQYIGMDPFTAAYQKDVNDVGGIDDDGDGEGFDDKDDTNPNIQ